MHYATQGLKSKILFHTISNSCRFVRLACVLPYKCVISLLKKGYTLKRLTKIMKQMLNGLAAQDAGEYLTMNQKLQVLGLPIDPATNISSDGAKVVMSSKIPLSRVALLNDERDPGAALQFAFEACKRQSAELDIVQHGPDTTNSTSMATEAKQFGIACELIQLGSGGVDSLAEYISSRRGLVYLVTASDDHLALTLSEQFVPRKWGYMHVPMVMVDRSKRPLAAGKT